MVNDKDGGLREENTVVLGQPIQRSGEVRFVFIKGSTTRAANQRVNDNQLGLMFFHQLDELGIALKLPVRLDHAVLGDGEVHLLQLFFELNERLITIQEHNRTLLHWNVISTNDKGFASCDVLSESPGRHGFTITTSAVDQNDRRMRQNIRDEIFAFGFGLHQLLNAHDVLGLFK